MKRISLTAIIVLACLSAFPQSAVTKALYRTFTDTYETKADSMTEAFIQTFMVMGKGYFNDKYKQYAFNAYWTQAHAIDVLIYNYERHKRLNTTLANKYLNYIKLWYKNKANNYAGTAASSTTTPNPSVDYKMFENPFTDDMCWITLTLLHIAEATGTSSYAMTGRYVFDNYIIKRAREDEETGGLWLPWNTDAGSTANACTQSPATLIAAKLYQRYGIAKYLDYAKRLYTYTAKKIVKSDGRVEEPPLTYTQGTFGEACRILYHVTDESASVKNNYKAKAYTYINYAFTSGRCTNGNNILRHEGTSGDQSIFKAVLIPYAVNFVLDEDMSNANRTAICKLILKNTAMLWKNMDFTNYPSKVFCNFDWTKKWTGNDSDGSMGAMCSGASLIENTARMCRAVSDRYDIGLLMTECDKVVIEPGHEGDAEWQTFLAAKANAQELIDNPNGRTSYDFRTAIANLENALSRAQDYATGIEETMSGESVGDAAVYDLNGRRVRSAAQGTEGLPSGLYIVGRRKVLVP